MSEFNDGRRLQVKEVQVCLRKGTQKGLAMLEVT